MEEVLVRKIGCNSGETGCWLRCGLRAYVDEKTGKLLKVTGNPEHSLSRGYACEERISHMVEFIYYPDQLKNPLKLVGERFGQWQQTSWEQVLDEIALKLKGFVPFMQFPHLEIFQHFLVFGK